MLLISNGVQCFFNAVQYVLNNAVQWYDWQCCVMVFCYIVCINSKTFLVVSPRFLVVRALERLPTWKFDLRDLEEVKKVNLPRLAASRRPYDNPKSRPDLQKGRAVYAYNVTGDFVAFLVRDLRLIIINPSLAQ